MGSVLKEQLRSLCCSDGWSYAVFWRFDQRNPMLLTMEDAYYEEQIGAVVSDMLLQVHMLGEGIVGETAFTGKHQWIFSDVRGDGWNSAVSAKSQEIFQDNSQIQSQFSSGIKTIAVISVESQGVIQFGSTYKILERPEFLDQTKKLFKEMENITGFTSLANPPSFLNCESYDMEEWFSSLCNEDITPVHGDSYTELMEIAYTPANLSQNPPFLLDVQEGMAPLCVGSLQSTNQPLMTRAISFSNPETQFQQVFSQSASSIHKSVVETPCLSTWSNEGSNLTSSESLLPLMIESHEFYSAKANTPVSCGNMKQDFQVDTSSFTRLCSKGGLVDIKKSVQENSGRTISNEHPAPSIYAIEGDPVENESCQKRFLEELKPDDILTDLFSPEEVDKLLEWLDHSPQHCISGTANRMDENLSQSIAITSVSSGLFGDVSLDSSFKQPAESAQSSISDTYACGAVNGGKKDLFEGLGLQFGSEQSGDCSKDLTMPAVCGSNLPNNSKESEGISKLDFGSMVAPRRALFSELGLEELLNGPSSSSYVIKSDIEDQLQSNKRRKMESSSVNGHQAHLGSLSTAVGSMKFQHAYNLEKINSLLPKKEGFHKSEVSLRIDDSSSTNTGITSLEKTNKPEEPVKATKKRARPGENPRPRPKDRQQIQDRIKELRGIIPDCGKVSIDALLDRTIRHMHFLQSVTQYADRLKQANEPKLIGHENKLLLKDNGSSGSGATWALEVGDQTMVCPVIVEDLGTPGLMLIEMLCEDRGFFLEIADVIRGFGFNILKGVMEMQEDKIWARFVVEATTHITRIEVLWSLVELLQRTSTGLDSKNQTTNVVNSGVSLLNNCQRPALACAVSLAETLQ